MGREGVEDGRKGSRLQIVLRFYYSSRCSKCSWQREMMLNRSLCRQAGSFFLLQSQWTAEALWEPHSVRKQRGDNGRVSVTVLALSGITRENLCAQPLTGGLSFRTELLRSVCGLNPSLCPRSQSLLSRCVGSYPHPLF